MTLLPDKITPLSHGDLQVALFGGYRIDFGRDPLPMELAVFYGQGLEENGAALQALHNFGVGNVKATSAWTGDTTRYECDETVSAAEAAHAQTLGPCELHPQPSGKVRVVCFPPHPWTTFRAFSTAEEGCAEYLRLFSWSRYAQAALRARAGDPVGFVFACQAAGYFTAPDVHGYASAVASIASHALASCEAVCAGSAPTIDAATIAHVEGLVALNLASYTWGDRDTADTEPAPATV